MPTILEREIDSFQDSYNITLTGFEKDGQEKWETMGGNNPDQIIYKCGTDDVTCVYATGFSFEVDGVRVSGCIPFTLVSTFNNTRDCWSDEDNADTLNVLNAIRAVCGRINYGETALGGV